MFQRAITKFNLDWDQVGFWVSLLCGIHCVAMPFVLGVMPFTNNGEMMHDTVESIVLVTTALVASYAFISGFIKHKNIFPGMMMLVGFSIICVTVFSSAESTEMILMPLGAIFIAFGHLKNHKLLH